MRMTAIHAQTERKRQDGSVRRAEKHHRRARTRRFRGLIRAVSAACATTAAAQGGKRLSGGRIQAIFASDSRPLGECREKEHAVFHVCIAGTHEFSGATLSAPKECCGTLVSNAINLGENMKPLLLSTFFSFVLAPAAFAETLSVVVQQTANAGTVRAAVYDSQAAFDASRMIAGTTSPASSGETLLSFENLTPGKYGIAVFHDLNSNEELDRNLFGGPKEPFGFSKNPNIGFSAPGFEEFAFEFDGSSQEMIINLNGN
jgi:uncharacterized protein (DUF2141 family)